VLEDVGLAGSADTYYENLSGGQKRRACVGTALVNDPDLLVLDEPTTGIDPTGRRELWRLLESFAEAGTTVLLTTHYMEEAEALADRVGLLSGGRLVALDTPAELIARHGGDSRLGLDVADGTAAEAALEAAGYRLLPDRRRVAVAVDPEGIPGVLEALSAADVDYEGLTWRQPGLEEVYVALTGTDVAPGGDPLPREARP
jgi:ABC-2 type transport system ATP-binding protein